MTSPIETAHALIHDTISEWKGRGDVHVSSIRVMNLLLDLRLEIQDDAALAGLVRSVDAWLKVTAARSLFDFEELGEIAGEFDAALALAVSDFAEGLASPATV